MGGMRPENFFMSVGRFGASSAFSARRQIGLVALAAFGLSLCIESLQLILRLGVFEITDLVLNTVGGVIGAWVSGRFRVKPGMREGA